MIAVSMRSPAIKHVTRDSRRVYAHCGTDCSFFGLDEAVAPPQRDSTCAGHAARNLAPPYKRQMQIQNGQTITLNHDEKRRQSRNAPTYRKDVRDVEEHRGPAI